MNFWRSYSAGKKMMVSLLTIAVISGCCGIISLFLMKSADRQYSNTLINYGFSQGDAGLLISSLKASGRNMMEMLALEDSDLQEKSRKDLQDNLDHMSKYIEVIRYTQITDQENKSFRVLEETLPVFRQCVQEFITLAADHSGKAEARQYYLDHLSEKLDQLEDAAYELMNSKITAGADLSEKLTRTGNITIGLILTPIIFAMFFTVLIAVKLKNTIDGPMAGISRRMARLSEGDLSCSQSLAGVKDGPGKLTEAVNELAEKLKGLIYETSGLIGDIAEGNLDVSYPSVYVGDFKPLYMSLSAMMDSLNDTLTRIDQIAVQVSGGADRITTELQILSQESEEQAFFMAELETAVKEISVRAGESADRVTETGRKSDNVGLQLMESNQRMQEMITVMEQINSSSSEIGKIIKTIEDIASQTNILSLNAAMEAARAGEAGKGLAVVADEVRNLAIKSRQASKATAQMVEKSIKAVESGSAIVEGTVNSLAAAAEGARELTAGINKIAEDSRFRTISVDQIMGKLDQMSSVIHTSSATVKESAETSRDLSGYAEEMSQLMRHFRLRRNENADDAATVYVEEKEGVTENTTENTSQAVTESTYEAEVALAAKPPARPAEGRGRSRAKAEQRDGKRKNKRRFWSNRY